MRNLFRKCLPLLLAGPVVAIAGGSDYGTPPGALATITGEVREWPVPTPKFARDPAPAPDGSIFIAVMRGNRIARFDPGTQQFREWELPKGATPWREPYEASLAKAPRMGYLAHEFTQGLGWYREAHNDYLQVLVELGLPGLLLASWAAVRLLRSLRRRPWFFAAGLGLLLQSLVEFSLQLPAVAALFVVVSACGVCRDQAHSPGTDLESASVNIRS